MYRSLFSHKSWELKKVSDLGTQKIDTSQQKHKFKYSINCLLTSYGYSIPHGSIRHDRAHKTTLKMRCQTVDHSVLTLQMQWPTIDYSVLTLQMQWPTIDYSVHTLQMQWPTIDYSVLTLQMHSPVLASQMFPLTPLSSQAHGRHSGKLKKPGRHSSQRRPPTFGRHL